MLVYELFSANFAKRILAADSIFLASWILLLVLWHFELLPDIIAVAVIAMMILSAAFNEGRVKKTCSNRFWQHMGNISYSLYLVHAPLAYVFYSIRGLLVNPDPLLKNSIGYNFPPLEASLGLVAFYIVTIGVASLTYAYIEKPARNYLNARNKNSQASIQLGETPCN